MKTTVYIFIGAIIAGVCPPVLAQEDFQALIESQRYSFQAQSLTAQRGGTRQLTSGYFIKVSKDTVMADLPYVGRSYSPSMNPTDSGIKFTSTDFEYTVTPKKKGGWKILIQPRDVRSSPRISISASAKGYASVQVSSNDKAGISYYGTIAK